MEKQAIVAQWTWAVILKGLGRFDGISSSHKCTEAYKWIPINGEIWKHPESKESILIRPGPTPENECTVHVLLPCPPNNAPTKPSLFPTYTARLPHTSFSPQFQNLSSFLLPTPVDGDHSLTQHSQSVSIPHNKDKLHTHTHWIKTHKPLHSALQPKNKTGPHPNQ